MPQPVRTWELGAPQIDECGEAQDADPKMPVKTAGGMGLARGYLIVSIVWYGR